MHFSREKIGNRLQEERKRIGLNQEEFALQIGVSKRTLAGYEGGGSDVGASVLGQSSALGVDVLYVVTGERKPTPADSIPADEAQLLEHYRSLPSPVKASVANLATTLANPSDE